MVQLVKQGVLQVQQLERLSGTQTRGEGTRRSNDADRYLRGRAQPLTLGGRITCRASPWIIVDPHSHSQQSHGSIQTKREPHHETRGSNQNRPMKSTGKRWKRCQRSVDQSICFFRRWKSLIFCVEKRTKICVDLVGIESFIKWCFFFFLFFLIILMEILFIINVWLVGVGWMVHF